MGAGLRRLRAPARHRTKSPQCHGFSRNLTAGAVLLGVWLCGAAFMFARLLVGMNRDRREAPHIYYALNNLYYMLRRTS